jgi:multicomponent Na+:H+ antiporter subunit F
VNLWLLAGAALLLGLLPCLLVTARGTAADAMVALQMASVVVSLGILLLAVGFNRSVYSDAAVLVALLSFAGGMAFVQYLERWGP